METAEKREAKHQKFQLSFGGTTQAEALEILGRVCGNEIYLKARLDSLLVQIEENRVLLDAAEKRDDIEGLKQWEELERRAHLLRFDADPIPQQLKNEREGIEFLEEAFRVEFEFRRLGYASIFAQPTPKKAPARARARKRR